MTEIRPKNIRKKLTQSAAWDRILENNVIPLFILKKTSICKESGTVGMKKAE
jgi:hypothetical protein